MNYFTSMTIKSTQIVWVRWPGCQGHKKPCKGCVEFCTTTPYYDHEDQPVEQLCAGETWYDETTCWKVTAVLKPETGPTVELNGMGQSIGECLAEIWQLAVDYEAAMAAAKIQRSEYE